MIVVKTRKLSSLRTSQLFRKVYTAPTAYHCEEQQDQFCIDVMTYEQGINVRLNLQVTENAPVYDTEGVHDNFSLTIRGRSRNNRYVLYIRFLSSLSPWPFRLLALFGCKAL